MRKTARDAAAKKLKELPPEPLATAIRWDASLSANDYVGQAVSVISQTEKRLSIFRSAGLPDEWFRVEIGKSRNAEALLHEAQFQICQPRYGLLQLLDKENWASERPTISVQAQVNQRGNFVASWTTPYPPRLYPPKYRLENTTGLKDDYFRQCWHQREAYGNTRPPSELLRFRNFPLKFDEANHPAVRHIMYAIRAEFDAVINEIKKSLQVVASPRIGFIRDDETGAEIDIT